jgi:hypothetical protein
LETASAAAAGYDQNDNRQRWLRYIDEASDRDDPTTIATVFSIAKKHGWRGWSPAVVTLPGNTGSTVVATTTPATGLKVTFGNIPHRQWLYGVDLVRGEITMLASPGGVGKSSLAIGIAVSIATAMALLDEKIYGSKLTALYVNAEDSTTEMRRRIWAFCLKHSVAEQDLGRFLLVGADDSRTQKISFMRSDKGNFVLDDVGIAHLEALIDELRPDVIVLDPLVALCGGGNLNDNAGMSLVMRALKRLANKFDCAILLLHHTRKGGDLSHAEAIGGASAIVNLARRAIMAVPMTTEEATKLGVLPSERSSYFKTVTSKSNLAPNTPDTPWYKLCNITLPNPEPPTYLSGDGVQAVTRVRLPLFTKASTGDDNKIRRAILDTIDGGKIIDGQPFQYSPNITGAKNERALVDDAMTAAEAATVPHVWLEPDLRAVVTRAIGALKTDGWIVEEEIKAGRFRRGRALRVQWARTPWADKHTVPLPPRRAN